MKSFVFAAVALLSWSAASAQVTFGISVANDQRGGARVTRIEPMSLAESVGLRNGDVIRKVNDIPVTTGTQLKTILSHPTTQTALLTWRRGNQYYLGGTRVFAVYHPEQVERTWTVLVTLPDGTQVPETRSGTYTVMVPSWETREYGALPIATEFIEGGWRQLQVTLGNAPDGGGVEVTKLGDGYAAQMGLQPGDVIVAVNDTPVSNIDELRDLVDPAAELRFTWSRGEAQYSGGVTLQVVGEGPEARWEREVVPASEFTPEPAAPEPAAPEQAAPPPVAPEQAAPAPAE